MFTFHESPKAGEWAARADRYFAEGLARFPDSLLLLFNQAHWSFFKPNADILAAESKFHNIIERFDDLEFDVHGADVAFAYTLHELDAVFPCYEYADVATSELVLRHTPELRGRKMLPHSTRDIIMAACHGYVGWAKLKNRDTAGGLAWLKYAMELYPHGLPTLRLYFDTLLRLAADAGKLTPALASDLAEAFIGVVNINPSILLTHVYTIVPILADNGERQAARDILAAWHRLANIIHKLRTDDEKHQLALLALLWDYRSLLPKPLLERIDEGLWDLEAMQDPTQLERRFIEVARTSSRAREETKMVEPQRPQGDGRRPRRPVAGGKRLWAGTHRFRQYPARPGALAACAPRRPEGLSQQDLAHGVARRVHAGAPAHAAMVGRQQVVEGRHERSAAAKVEAALRIAGLVDASGQEPAARRVVC